MPRPVARLPACALAEQSQRELFEVLKIHGGQFAFGAGKLLREILRQFEQSGRVRAHPFPVLRERVHLFAHGRHGMQKPCVTKKLFDRIAQSPLHSVGPVLVRVEDLCQGRSDLFTRRVLWQIAQPLCAAMSVEVFLGLALENRQPRFAPLVDPLAQPLFPPVGPRTLEGRQVFVEPCLRVAQRLCVVMDAQDEIANRLVPAAALFENELLHRLRDGRAARVVLSQHAIECFAREQTGLFLGQHRQLGIEAEFVKMFADQLEAETVQGRNTRRIDQRELFGQPGVVQVRTRLFLQLVAQPLPHFGRRRLSERDHQDAIKRHWLRRVAHAGQTPLHQRARLACSRTGNNQHIAVLFNRAPLAVSEGAHVFFVAVGFLFNTRN